MIHRLALIGEPPEHRDWSPNEAAYFPKIDETAKIGAFVSIDSGLKDHTRVGPRSFLMKHVHVGHDARIGADCELAPGVVVGGHCVIGDGVRIGVNASLRPFVRIGKGARIGAGAVVVKDVPPGEVWVGNPARQIVKHADPVAEGWMEWWEARERQKATANEIQEYAARVIARCD